MAAGAVSLPLTYSLVGSGPHEQLFYLTLGEMHLLVG